MSQDDELWRELGAVLDGQPIDEVIPALLIATARALSGEAGGDEAKLGRLLNRYDELLADQAFAMLQEEAS